MKVSDNYFQLFANTVLLHRRQITPSSSNVTLSMRFKTASGKNLSWSRKPRRIWTPREARGIIECDKGALGELFERDLRI